MTNLDVALSANFRLREFLRSDFATRMGMEIIPSDQEIHNLTRLCVLVLQPLRNAVRSTMRITSGYRPSWLNNAIGGSATSAHVYGCAADIEVDGMENKDVCKLVQEMALPVDQCILEFPPNGWVHLGIERVGAARRNQFLTARNIHGKTEYSEGIHP
jgi:hypothetical protein